MLEVRIRVCNAEMEICDIRSRNVTKPIKVQN